MVAAAGNAGVEGDIFGGVVLAAQAEPFYLAAKCLQFRLVFRRGVRRGGSGNFRFQNQPHVHQFQSQFVFVIQPRKSQGIFCQTAVTFYIGAVPAPYFQDPFGDKTFDGFPNGAAANLEHLPQFKFIGQLFPYGHGGSQNIGHQIIFGLGAQKFPLGLCLFHRPLLHHGLDDSVIPHTRIESNEPVPLARGKGLWYDRNTYNRPVSGPGAGGYQRFGGIYVYCGTGPVFERTGTGSL